jgi:hypothetical protein
VIDSNISAFPQESVNFAFAIGLFDVVAELATAFPDQFADYIRFFITASRHNDLVLRRFVSDDATFYEFLGEALRANPRNVPILLEFSLIRQQPSRDHRLIRNSRAVELLLASAKCSDENERFVLEELNSLAKLSRNLEELSKYPIVAAVLDGISEVQHQPRVLASCIELYQRITRHSFSLAAFHKTVSLLKSESFLYPNKILDVLLKLIASPNTCSPLAYFQFDGQESGISASNILVVGEDFSICCSFTLWPLKSRGVQPLICFYDRQSNESLVFHFKERRLWVSWKSVSRAFRARFENGTWYFVVVSVTPKGFSLLINGSRLMSVHSSGRLPLEFSVHIRAKPDRKGSLSADISRVFVFRVAEFTRQMTAWMSPPSLPPFLASAFVCCFNPSNMHNEQVIDVSPTNSSVPLRGAVVPFMSTVHDVLPPTVSLSSILPLFSRLFDDTLDSHPGRELFRMLIEMIGKILTLSKASQFLFESIHGFRLLSGFLSLVKSQNMNEAFMTSLFDLF